jgi:hypothetical protein
MRRQILQIDCITSFVETYFVDMSGHSLPSHSSTAATFSTLPKTSPYMTERHVITKDQEKGNISRMPSTLSWPRRRLLATALLLVFVISITLHGYQTLREVSRLLVTSSGMRRRPVRQWFLCHAVVLSVEAAISAWNMSANT